MKKYRLVLIAAVLAAVTGFPTLAADHGQPPVHWSYGGGAGPEKWGELKPEYKACSAGRQQSPININIEDTLNSEIGAIEFFYKPTPLKVLNNGHTIQVDYAPGSSMTVAGHRYELLQFHFHAPSEHRINGKRARMEAHLVHKNAAGELAVVGVMMNRGAANGTVAAIWKHIPHELDKVIAVDGVTVNAADLLPAKPQRFYHYMGSLTTPPCTENVSWFVMKYDVSVADSQLTDFGYTIGSNARPVQPLNRRFILVNE